MADLASFEDLEQVWRPLSASERGAATMLFRWASALVREEVPSIDSRITAGTLDPDIAAIVVVAMVKRVLANPEGAKSRSESLEDFSWQVVLADDGDGSLYLTDRERQRLQPRRRGAFTIRPGAGGQL